MPRAKSRKRPGSDRSCATNHLRIAVAPMGSAGCGVRRQQKAFKGCISPFRIARKIQQAALLGRPTISSTGRSPVSESDMARPSFGQNAPTNTHEQWNRS